MQLPWLNEICKVCMEEKKNTHLLVLKKKSNPFADQEETPQNLH